jgi:hypothetical protein
MTEWPVWIRLVVGILATWRLAHLISREDGPFDVIASLRAHAGAGQIGRLMDCPYCLSIWIAVPFAFPVADNGGGWIAAWLAISGGASIVQRAIDGSNGPPEDA